MYELRDYQKRGIRQIFEAWDPKRGNMKKVLFQMATGTGKTTVFSEIVRKAHIKEKDVLIVAHRAELVEQIVNRLEVAGVQSGCISASFEENRNLNVQVASIQTLTRRKKPKAEIVIIDECHHSKASTYKKLWEIYPDAWFLGVTATPWRLSGEGFEEQFETLICLENLSYFFKNKHLSPVKHLVSGVPNLSKVKKQMKDYDLKMLNNIMLENRLMANLVNSYFQHANGKRMIVFAVDIEHSLEIARRYNLNGVKAEHIDAKTPKTERKAILESFKSGETLIISNVDIISEGFDVPDCDAVQLARPTKSLALYLQQVGRCMRKAEGKEFGIVLDNAGLWLEHGLSNIDRHWQIEPWKFTSSSTKRNSSIEDTSSFAAMDEEGVFHDVIRPQEAEGLELVNMTEEIADCLSFHYYLENALELGHKPISAIYKFTEHLFYNKKYLSDVVIDYAHKRLIEQGIDYKKGIWYHRKKDLKNAIDNNLPILI